MGRIFTSRVHTSRYWTEVVVAPQLRRRGYGRQMVAHLAVLRPESKPLCTREYVSSESVLFACRLGARPYQTCPPQQVATRDASYLVPGGPVTLPGSALKPDDLRRAWTDIYAWVHDSWSPVVPGIEEPLLAGFSDDLDLPHTRVVATPTIRAAAFVFRDDRQPVVVADCRASNEPAGLELLRACVRDSLMSLAEDGATSVTFDGHDSDPHFRPLLDELTSTGEPFELLELDCT